MSYYFKENENHFAPTDPPKSRELYTEHFWKERIKKAIEECRTEQAVRLFLFSIENNDEIIGTVTFTQFSRGPFQACNVGYGISHRHEGRGLMTEALSEGIHYVFVKMNIHRIMANYLEDNSRSAKLLKRLGFTIEGKALKYLYINGCWRDHILTSLINPEWKERF